MHGTTLTNCGLLHTKTINFLNKKQYVAKQAILTMFMDPVFLALIMTTTRRKKSASFSLMSSSHGEDPAAASNSMEQSGGVRRRNRKAVDRIWKKGGNEMSSQKNLRAQFGPSSICCKISWRAARLSYNRWIICCENNDLFRYEKGHNFRRRNDGLWSPKSTKNEILTHEVDDIVWPGEELLEVRQEGGGRGHGGGQQEVKSTSDIKKIKDADFFAALFCFSIFNFSRLRDFFNRFMAWKVAWVCFRSFPPFSASPLAPLFWQVGRQKHENKTGQDKGDKSGAKT